MTDRRTDGRADGQTDARGKTICLPNLKGGDIKKEKEKKKKTKMKKVCTGRGLNIHYSNWKADTLTIRPLRHIIMDIYHIIKT